MRLSVVMFCTYSFFVSGMKLSAFFSCIYLVLFFCEIRVKFLIKTEQQRKKIIFLTYKRLHLYHNYQARIQEHKNLDWRCTSCLASQDSVYMDLARKSRSVFCRQESCIEEMEKESWLETKKNKNLEITMARTWTCV